MLRRLFRSNWIFLVVGFIGLAFAIPGSLPVGGPPISFVPSKSAFNLIASLCGIVAFAVQFLVWTVNLILWAARRVKTA